MEISLHRPRRLLLGTEASSPPYNGDRSDNLYYSGETNLNSNMIIVVAALLCAFIFALALNSIAHCALIRRGHTFSSEALDEAASNFAAMRDRQIPEVIYEPRLGVLVTDCPICLGEFAEGEKVRVLPKCNHSFHVKCIDEWLRSHQSCPLCRQPILDRSTG